MLKFIEKDLTKSSTIRTKACTKFFREVNTINDLDECTNFAKMNKLDIVILGKGTNLLFTQQYYENKLFIKQGKGFNFFKISNNIVEIGASNSFIRAGIKLTSLGYQDFIYMTLIPGSVGGGVRQNAGTTYEGEVKDNFLSAKVYDLKENKILILNNEQMNFEYRNSFLQFEKNRYILLSVKFLLKDKVKDIATLKKIVKEKQKIKREKEPKGFSFGSTFKSKKYPKKVWWYIDQVELRGYNIGGAKFSEKHPNWIINYNKATASNILDLINKAQQLVLKKFKIDLDLEVELI